MDHLLMLLLLLWSSGLQAEGQHDATGAQCESTDKADIVLLVDGSWSIGRLNFKRIRSFVAGIVSAFDIGPDRVQIGLAQYSGDPKTEWHLNTHQTKQSLLEAVANLPYKGGNTMTGKALDYILRHNFKPNVGMRADSQKIAVLITDGKSQDDILLPSQNLKDTGIEIYAIGVKNADKMELRSIASDPNKTHMYNVVDFPFLRDIVDDLIINLCNSTNLEPVRLVGGDSRCAGTLKLKQGEWRPVYGSHWTLTTAAVVCRELDCGPAVSIGMRDESSHKSAWEISSSCVQSGSALRECVSTGSSSSIMEITCSEAQAQLETPARLAKLLDSPAQVEEEQL